MKSIALSLLTMITLAMFSLKLSAQSAPLFGIGLNAGQGIGRADGLAMGADLQFLIGAGKNLYVPITIGFTSITAKDKISPISGKTYTVESEKYFPLKAGLKYFFEASSSRFYGLMETGLALGIEVPKGGGVYLPIIFSPALGYALNNGLDIAVKYETCRKESYAGIRIGYGF